MQQFCEPFYFLPLKPKKVFTQLSAPQAEHWCDTSIMGIGTKIIHWSMFYFFPDDIWIKSVKRRQWDFVCRLEGGRWFLSLRTLSFKDQHPRSPWHHCLLWWRYYFLLAEKSLWFYLSHLSGIRVRDSWHLHVSFWFQTDVAMTKERGREGKLIWTWPVRCDFYTERAILGFFSFSSAPVFLSLLRTDQEGPHFGPGVVYADDILAA